MSTRGLPIVIGVSGHRDLRAEDEPALTKAVHDLFTRFRASFPMTELILFSPLAAGADRLVAKVAVAMKIRLRVPMPFPEAEYRKDFDAAETLEFNELMAAAEESYAVPFVLDNTIDNVGDPARREQQYVAVGAYVARISQLFIALWNGKPTARRGGTAEIVGYRLNGVPLAYRKPTAVLDSPEIGPVYHIMTPRRSDPVTPAPPGTLTLLTRRGTVPLDADPVAPIHRRIERFNHDSVLHVVEVEPQASNILAVRDVAEKLATYYQRQYNRALTAIFAAAGIAASALVMAHTFERQSPYLLYSLLVVASFILYLVVTRKNLKDRFIEYRALEFGLFVQRHWDLAGVETSVADVYLRVQRSDIDWIREAVRTVHHLDGPPPAPQADAAIASVRELVTGQRAFFTKASQRDNERCERYERVSWAFFAVGLVCTVLLACSVVYHLASAGHDVVDSAFWRWDNDQVIVLGIELATIWSAVFHEYPTRRAFHAQARRYLTMLGLYDRALEVLDDGLPLSPAVQVKTAQDVARELGVEALAENGEWVMMHRELPLEVLHI